MGIYSDPDLYCVAFPPPTDEEVRRVLGAVAEPPETFLEPMCGHARAAEAVFARGVRYVGFDVSPEMVARAPRRDGITTAVADARDFDLSAELPEGFDVAWCPVNSLAHLANREDVVRHLEAMRRHAHDGSAYLVELEIYDRAGSTEDASWSVPHPGGGVVEASWTCGACDLAARTREETGAFRHVVGGEVVAERRERFSMRMWTYADLVELPREAGWRLDPVCWLHVPGGAGRRAAVGRHVENSGCNWTFTLRTRA
ncbi:MAG: class I SAM-dependent methyltransferase [Planctomycetota bacterium]